MLLLLLQLAPMLLVVVASAAFDSASVAIAGALACSSLLPFYQLHLVLLFFLSIPTIFLKSCN
jgi:hypothetical protein